MNGPCPSVQKHTRFKPLDLATSEAVHELAAAIRRVRALERVDVAGLSVVGRSDHKRKQTFAKAQRAAAREALESLLEEP